MGKLNEDKKLDGANLLIENRNVSEKMERTRIDWLDAMKGWTILFVVLGHVLLGYVENDSFPQSTNLLKIVQDWIYIWHMPLFFAISGYTFFLSYKKKNISDRQRLKRQEINLILIYLIFSLVLGVTKTIFANFVDNPMNMPEMIKGIILPNTLMWYLWVLVLYYFLFSRFTFVESHVWIVGCIAALLIGRYLDETMHLRICLKNFLCCIGYFYIGSHMEGLLKNIKILKWLQYVAMMILWIGGVMYVLLYNEYISTPVIVRALVDAIYATAMILSCFCFFRKYIKKSKLCELGKASLVIYLLHTYLVTIIKNIVIKSGFDLVIVAIIGSWLVATFVTYLIWILSCRIEWIGYIFHPIDAFEKVTTKWEK